MSEPLRIGLAGCGRLAEAGYAPAAARARGVEIAAVFDPDPRRAGALADAAGLPRESVYADAGQMISGARPDALVVASPASTHVENASLAAAAGIPSLVEKPPAADAAGARELAALDPAPLIAFNRRFSLGRGLADAGAGAVAPARIEAVLHYRRRAWDPVGDLGDAWLDLGPHLLDLALLARAGELEVGSASLDPALARVELAAPGCRVTVECATDRPHRERFRVEAEDGRTILDERDGGLRGLIPRPGRPHPLVASLAGQLESFALLVRGGEPAGPSPATAVEGLRVMELIDAARERAGALSA